MEPLSIVSFEYGVVYWTASMVLGFTFIGFPCESSGLGGGLGGWAERTQYPLIKEYVLNYMDLNIVNIVS